jgi:hypothetical protein
LVKAHAVKVSDHLCSVMLWGVPAKMSDWRS